MISAIEKAKAKLAKVDAGKTVQAVWSLDTPANDSSDERIAIPANIATEINAQVELNEGQQAASIKRDVMSARANLLAAGRETQFGAFVLLGDIAGRFSVIDSASEAGTDYIRGAMQSASKKMPPKSEVENICVEIRNAARQHGRRITVHHRIARTLQGRVLDLGDPEGRIVVVTADGWQIERNDSTAFVRGRGYGALPIPVKTASARSSMKLLLGWLAALGVPKSRAPLVVVALVTWLRTGNAYPLLLLYGAPGTGKTTAARLLLLLLDPTESMTLPTIKTEAEHIAAAAQHRHVLSFDNESKLSAAEQDLLCTCATGGEIVTRRLYSNGDVAILPIHRPVLMTAVQPVVTRPDLMSRTIPVEFPARSVRQRDDEIMAEFLQIRPELLGALLELMTLGEKHD